jgi:cation diffusion facilitator CzcD-associated flavoprotein CzcO
MSLSCAAVVVGAGPAGLAAAACLKQRGIDPLVLESGPSAGTSWRNHYERLHLHTVKEHSALPGLPFPASVPRYPSRLEVVRYLDAYAGRFGIAPRVKQTVRRIAIVENGFAVETAEDVHHTPIVVVATGMNRVPNPKALPDQSIFEGSVIHAARYRNADGYARSRVLVVGAGNTGAEIALDLAEHEVPTTLAVRTPVNVIRRDFLGIPAQVTSIRFRNLPAPVLDRLGQWMSRAAFGDLTRYGLSPASVGLVSSIVRRGRIPIIDVGTVDAIKQGRVTVKPGSVRLTRRGAVFADGSDAPFDAVILATGYGTGLEDIVSVPGAIDVRGRPIKWSPVRGLYFVGFENVATGLLREIALQARAVARDVARRRVSPSARPRA